jgi:hypothetical protein
MFLNEFRDDIDSGFCRNISLCKIIHTCFPFLCNPVAKCSSRAVNMSDLL